MTFGQLKRILDYAARLAQRNRHMFDLRCVKTVLQKTLRYDVSPRVA